jgi:hypothetical protein
MATAHSPGTSRAVWRKSRHSANAGNCVEVAGTLAGVIAVRDSKYHHGPVVVITAEQWRRFAARVKADQHGLP